MTHFCPICQKVLLYRGDNDLFCQTRIKFEGKVDLSHYQSHIEDGITWFAPPYKIQIHAGASRIFRLVDDRFSGRFVKPEFEFIFETKSEFHVDNPEKVAQRIKTLILFS